MIEAIPGFWRPKIHLISYQGCLGRRERVLEKNVVNFTINSLEIEMNGLRKLSCAFI
jgi:hypothetical protein